MKVTRRQLRRLILKEIRLISEEGSTSIKDAMSDFIGNKKFIVIDMGRLGSGARLSVSQAKAKAADKLGKEKKDLKIKSFGGTKELKDTKPGNEYLLVVVK